MNSAIFVKSKKFTLIVIAGLLLISLIGCSLNEFDSEVTIQYIEDSEHVEYFILSAEDTSDTYIEDNLNPQDVVDTGIFGERKTITYTFTNLDTRADIQLTFEHDKLIERYNHTYDPDRIEITEDDEDITFNLNDAYIHEDEISFD